MNTGARFAASSGRAPGRGGWLRGTRQKKGAEPIYGVEQAAHANAEKLLREAGFIP